MSSLSSDMPVNTTGQTMQYYPQINRSKHQSTAYNCMVGVVGVTRICSRTAYYGTP